MNIEKTIKNLEKRGYKVSYFDSSDAAVSYLRDNIKNTNVGIGGSVTANTLKLHQLLAEENAVYSHHLIPGNETIAKANSAEVYITSANAISEDGEILNIDGRGNRLAAQVFGDKRLYIVAGTNKICPDFMSALERARNVASPLNCERLNLNTPCRADGKCHDCHSADRICNALLVHWAPMRGMDTEVVLIGEKLGY